jgi:hypothetical protein
VDLSDGVCGRDAGVIKTVVSFPSSGDCESIQLPKPI